MSNLPPDRAEPPPGATPSSRSEQLPFDALYERWFDDVSRWVRALGAPEADRDDLVQEVFVVVHRRLGDFDGQNVAGWLYRIARRKVRDYRRLLWVKKVIGMEPVHEATLKTLHGPLDALETKQRAALLEVFLNALNEDQRAAFVLFEVEGRSGEEIAAIQGVPVNTVWARIHKARKKLHSAAGRWQREGVRRSLR